MTSTRTYSDVALVGIGLVGLLLASCGGAGTSSAETTLAESTPTSSIPQSAVAPTTTTAVPTTTPGPPVYDPRAVGDIFDLPSFIHTVTVANTNAGQLSENSTSTGFIKDPNSVYQLATFSYDGTTDGVRSYLIDGRSYEENQFGDWYLYERGSSSAPHFTNRSDLPPGALGDVLTARLAGQEDYSGIPANHFVFDETDLGVYSAYTPENPSPTVEGDFYLAQEGNYVLYSHSKETSPGRIYEVTETLSSVGQLTEIVLPPELAPMSQALDIGVELSRLLPPGSELSEMIRYTHGIGVDYYTYFTPLRANEDFLAFFRALPPTDGWAVSHIGHIKLHLEQINCETRADCVILKKGGEQIVVSFGAGIILEYDHEHVFAPL